MIGFIIDFTHVADAANYEHDALLDNREQTYVLSQETHLVSGIISGAKTDTQPIDEYQQTRDGHIIQMFFGDYYDRVHIIPDRIDLGNLLNEQTRDVEIWNAYTHEIRLENIESSGVDGIKWDVSTGTFAPLESRTYEVSISTKGPPIIDALFEFTFGGEVYSFAITGKRVVVWPFIPLVKYTETLEWMTDVIETRKSEQRLSLRQAPRQSFDYSHALNSHDFSRAKTMLLEWRQRVFGVPVWCEFTEVGEVAQGQSTISLDTTIADYREDDMALIFEDSGKLEAVQTLTVTDTSITLKNPVSQDYKKALVMPLRFGQMTGNRFDRPIGFITKASVDFIITQNIDISKSNRDKYLGYDLVNECSLVDITENIMRDVWTFDNGVSDILNITIGDEARHRSQMKWFCKDQKSLYTLRQWLHSRAGRYKSFWRTSNNDDLILLDVLVSTSTSAKVKATGRAAFGNDIHFAIFLKNGDKKYGKFIGADNNTDGSETLYLDKPLGIDIAPDDVKSIQYMSLVRLDSDRVEIEHLEKNYAKVSVPLISLNEEYEGV